MSQRLYLPFEQVFSNLGVIGAGYKIYTYVTQTDTPKATYSNVGLTVPNTNPIVADSAGRFGNIYGSSATLYKFILKTAQDVTIATADPVDPQTFTLADFTPMPAAYWGTTAGTSSAYTLDSDVDISVIGYQNYQIFALTFHTACAASPTLNIDGLGALNLKKYTGQGTKVALLEGDVQTQRYWATNDGVDIVILNPRTLPTYLGVPPTLSVSTNILTLTNVGSSYLVNTASGAQTINTINGLVSGQTAVIGISSNSNAATFATGVDNIINPSGADAILTSINDKITIYFDGTNNIITSARPVRFGDYVDKTIETVYQADYDGILMFTVYYAGDSQAKILSDSSNPPTTLIVDADVDNSVSPLSVTASIKKGNYYKATTAGASKDSYILKWQPLLNN